MYITDRVYGTTEITEPVILDLIASAPLQRLKHIHSAGPSALIFDRDEVTRLEHSIGVMLLLRQLGASVEEQVAGLLHDVPHTAFSHVADFVFPNENHEFHEQHMQRLVRNSAIPEILAQYGLDIERILEEEYFPLLEQGLPELCADRIDYALRDREAYTRASTHKQHQLSHLIVFNDEIIFDDRDAATTFAYDFLWMDKHHWAAPVETAAYELFARAIKEAFTTGALTKDDLFTNDKTVLKRLRVAGKHNQKIDNILARLRPGFSVRPDEEQPEITCRTKCRIVDPKFVDGDRITRVSAVSDAFAQLANSHRERVDAGYRLTGE